MSEHEDFDDVYGNRVVVQPEHWTFVTSKGVERLSWKALDRLGGGFRSLCQDFVQNRLLTVSPIEAANCHRELSAFAHFCESQATATVQVWALSYLSHLTSNGRRYRWARIRSFCRYFQNRRHPEFDRETQREIDAVKIGGNPKGAAVKSGDQIKGPFSREEAFLWQRAILTDDDDSYSAVQERAVTALITVSGLRPVSLIHLLERDFVKHSTVDETPVSFELAVSRAKKRVAPRTLLRDVPVHPQLAEMIQKLIDANRQMYPYPVAEDERPLLFASTQNSDFGPLGLRKHSAEIAAIVQRAAKRYGITSPRTELPLNVFPRRLRSSAATALAQEGYSAEQIAAFLDHEDLQHVGDYADAGRYTAGYLDAALADRYAPFINAFKGAIPKPSKRTPGGITVSYVTDDGRLLVLGECAQKRIPCVLHPPYSCYGDCDKFEPFSDAEHDALQTDLHNRREELRTARTVAKRRMATLLDSTIFGVAQVKNLVEDMNDE